MRTLAIAAVLSALFTAGLAIAAPAKLGIRRGPGRAHVPARLHPPKQVPVAWVAHVRPTPEVGSPAATGPAGGSDAPPAPTRPSDAPPPPDQSALPSRTGVQLDETPDYKLIIAHNPVAAGEVEITANNVGEDEHDLTLRNSAEVLATTGPIAPGDARQITRTLAAGSYTLYCSINDHESLGMKATLRVE